MYTTEPLPPPKIFSVSDALNIQLATMARWKAVLSPAAFADLDSQVAARNRRGYARPEDVWRGDHLARLVEGMVFGFDAENCFKLP